MKTTDNNELSLIEYSIKYYFVFCSRYRRKIFNIAGLKQRFVELTRLYCKEQNLILEDIDFYDDSVVMRVSSVPTLSPSDIMNGVKKRSSKILREEFLELNSMTSLWTRNFLVSTTPLSKESIECYISIQKKRL